MIELRIKDDLSVSDRIAVEAGRILASKLPEGAEIFEKIVGEPLKAKMSDANGYSGRSEMFSALEIMGIEYFLNPDSFNDYQFSIFARKENIDDIKKTIAASGYAIAALAKRYFPN